MARYILRNPFSTAKMHFETGAGSVLYRSRMNKKQDGDFAALPPTDFIAEVTQHIPDKGFELVRYYGWPLWDLRMMLDSWPTARFRHESNPKGDVLDQDSKTKFLAVRGCGRRNECHGSPGRASREGRRSDWRPRNHWTWAGASGRNQPIIAAECDEAMRRRSNANAGK